MLGIVGAVKSLLCLLLISFLTNLGLFFLEGLGAGRLLPTLTVVGHLVYIAVVIADGIMAYLGYRLYKVSDLLSVPPKVRDRWVVILVVIAALSLVIGSTLPVAAAVIAMAGLLLLPRGELAPKPEIRDR